MHVGFTHVLNHFHHHALQVLVGLLRLGFIKVAHLKDFLPQHIYNFLFRFVHLFVSDRLDEVSAPLRVREVLRYLKRGIDWNLVAVLLVLVREW